eukprot:CAMPEP_0179489412 /NCGR_PEP_ID=MMETSP0799-20121207/64794_1 /TAXON_ID=46947 /ORGANISM="Geminigera cryophila, Strain CCMP2564" /LENGTH=151 /DNA_ID=CAMNT_0021305301 /DNA_START=96 /DNA_END=548 /DNA_ORIENTATION=+
MGVADGLAADSMVGEGCEDFIQVVALEEMPAPQICASKTDGASTARGSLSTAMFRSAGEEIFTEDVADGEKATDKGLPAWIFCVPMVLITLEPTRRGQWNVLAASRQAHAQLQASWTASSYSQTQISAKPPTNEPPTPYTGLENSGGIRPE